MARIDYHTANNLGRCRIFWGGEGGWGWVGEKKARELRVRTNKRLDAVEYLDQSMDRHNENVCGRCGWWIPIALKHGIHPSVAQHRFK